MTELPHAPFPDLPAARGAETLVRRTESVNSGPVAHRGDAVRSMLEARSVALVGASPRPGTFGRRMLDEVQKSPAGPRTYPVNPKYAELDGSQCYPTLADLPEAPELTLLAVPDQALEQQLALAAAVGSRGAVIFGNAHEEPAVAGCGPGLRQRHLGRRTGPAPDAA